MLPDLESLRCFVAAAEHRNFRRAAHAVALSPPAFGDRIRRLEDFVSGRLFERSTRRVALTVAGTRLLPEARRLLEEAARLAGIASAGAAAPSFELTLGTRFELGLSWLVPSLPGLERSRPERTLHVSFGDSPDLLSRVRGERIDAAITSARLSSAELKFAPLHEERYVFVARRDLLRRKPLTRAEDAAVHTLIDVDRELPLFRYFLDAAPRAERWAFGRVLHMGGIGAIRARVLDGAGVAVLPAYFVRDDLAKKRLVPVLPRVRLPSDHFRLVWRRGHAHEAELVELAGELRGLALR